jgi:hypothetical protein
MNSRDSRVEAVSNTSTVALRFLTVIRTNDPSARNVEGLKENSN